jgi:hypothetical protein
MAPKNRIVTLDDINNNHATSNSQKDGAGPSSLEGSYSQGGGVGSEEFEYCKPIGQGHATPSGQSRNIPLHTIPGLVQNDVCMATLKRIHDEFSPIIQRRGYNVTSISELCCCGDGLDHADYDTGNGRKKRKCRKMGNNVWGYNQTTFRGGSRDKKNSKSHSIHLRLRQPLDHRQLFPWEDVAGTMAHELSHCVHQNHGKDFYKLMEEILEEHATIQTQTLISEQPSHRGGWDRSRSGVPEVENKTTGSVSSATSDGDGGHRLGGTVASDKSRLLDEFSAGGGVKLGGRPRAGKSGRELRELTARAAESRQRQMLQIRRMIERSKEPCVIEIFDDDDDVHVAHDKRNGNGRDIGVVSDSGTTRGSNRKRAGKRLKRDRNNDPILSHQRRKASNEKSSTTLSRNDLVIDLTAAASDIPIAAGKGNWSCGRCTYENRAGADRCEMCLGRR